MTGHGDLPALELGGFRILKWIGGDALQDQFFTVVGVQNEAGVLARRAWTHLLPLDPAAQLLRTPIPQ